MAESAPVIPSASGGQSQTMRLHAVLAGWAVDIGGTTLFSMVWGTLLSIAVLTAGGDEAELQAAMRTVPLLAFIMLTGAGFTVLGGFAAAFIAGRDELWHALATGILSLLTGILFIVISREQSPLWYNVTALLVTLPCALAGGWLRLLLRRR
ncbi:MAG TPA: hypothetical protein PKM88_03155 [bacterium]|nr:hypothetical protein [bacterium]